MGRPSFEPKPEERQLVRNLVAVGVAHAQIAAVIMRPRGKKQEPKPITLPTLRRHFKLELETGTTQVHALLAGRMLRTALGHNEKAHAKDELRAQMFLLKTKFGYRENTGLLADLDDGEESEVINVAAKIAGLIELGRRRQGLPAPGDVVDAEFSEADGK